MGLSILRFFLEEGDKIAATGERYPPPQDGKGVFTLEIGNHCLEVHGLQPRDFWIIASVVEGAALAVSPPDGWLEPPVPGKLEVNETDAGPQIGVAVEPDEGPTYAIPDDTTAEEKERLTRLIQTSEPLLEFAKWCIAPAYSDHEKVNDISSFVRLVQGRALQLVQTVEPETPVSLSGAAAKIEDARRIRYNQERPPNITNCSTD